MARIGGRNSWIAVPAGLVCAGVVVTLVWLSLPMVPVAVAWVGDTLRSATTPQPSATPVETPAQRAAQDGSLDCRTLYPDELWNELTWHAGSLLNQTSDPPATTVTALADALGPSVSVTCDWRLDSGGGIVTTLARVAPDAQTIAEAALRGQGFDCAVADAALECVRTQGAVREEHTVREDLWLSSVESSWHPETYGGRLAAHVWG